MEKLYKGIHKFRESYFTKEEDFFKGLSHSQGPEVLFITCSDSRVDPNLVTQSLPGELFIVRNVGNIVPPYNAGRGKSSAIAAIEFAVLVLGVKDIILCGHSNCGAVAALHMEEDKFAEMPYLKEWLKICSPVTDTVNKYYQHLEGAKRQKVTEEENILFQLRNIETYPFVAERLNRGELHLHGWYYDIGTGHVHSYNPVSDSFEKIVYKGDKDE